MTCIVMLLCTVVNSCAQTQNKVLENGVYCCLVVYRIPQSVMCHGHAVSARKKHRQIVCYAAHVVDGCIGHVNVSPMTSCGNYIFCRSHTSALPVSKRLMENTTFMLA